MGRTITTEELFGKTRQTVTTEELFAKPRKRVLTTQELQDLRPIAPEDPEAPPELLIPKVGPIAKTLGKVVERGLEYGGKGAWAGLGALAWPFERISGAIGTPLSEINKARAEYIARGEDMPFGGEIPVLKKSAKIVGKSLISRKMPK